MIRPEVRSRNCDMAIAILSWSYIVFAYMVVEYNIPYVPVCPFFLLSGFHCPLCGSTRLLGMYLHGIIDSQPPSFAVGAWIVFICVLAVISTTACVTAFLGRQGCRGDGGVIINKNVLLSVK